MVHMSNEPIKQPPTAWPDDEVRSFKAWCKYAGFSTATGRRLIVAGQGPIITRLSARRIGIRGLHHRLWLDQRAKGGAA